MLKMCGERAASGSYRPAVLADADSVPLCIDHRLDTDAHTGLQPDVHILGTLLYVVGNLRRFVQMSADAVAAVFADDAVAPGSAVLLDSAAYLLKSRTGLRLCDALIE